MPRSFAEHLDVTERTLTTAVRDAVGAGYLTKHRSTAAATATDQHVVPLHAAPGGRRTVADILRALGDVEPSPDADPS